MNSHQFRIVQQLAAAVLAGEWQSTAMQERLAEAIGKRSRWIRPFVYRLLQSFPEPSSIEQIITQFSADSGFTRVWNRSVSLRDSRQKLQIVKYFFLPATMSPSEVPGSERIQKIETPGQLGEWLGLSANDLLWFADVRGLNADADFIRMKHYSCVWVPKRSGGWRLLEIPKPRLKLIQRKILHEILDHIPPHEAAHGFRKSRSTLSFASPHCGRAVVMRFDLNDFFTAVPFGRVFGLFRQIGYPDKVAKLLAGLCCVRLGEVDWNRRPNPKSDGSDHAKWQRLSGPHLPQGAPTSPALANLCAFHLDVRLSAYARSIEATYTRYADDLAISGGPELLSSCRAVRKAVTTITAEKGFAINLGKHRTMTQGHRQQIAGMVVNVRPNVSRPDFELLKAILTNCIRHGPDSQNRQQHPDFRNHLAGRVAWISSTNPQRGRKLTALFNMIHW